MALSIQLLKGAARLAYSRCSWSMVSSCFSVFWGGWAGMGQRGEVSRRAGGWRSRAPGGQNVPSGCHPPPHQPPGAQGSAGDVTCPHLQSFPATLGQRAEGIPLVADLLAAGVDVVGVVVVQLAVGGARGHETRQRAGKAALGPPSPLVPGHQSSITPQAHTLPKAGGMQTGEVIEGWGQGSPQLTGYET